MMGISGVHQKREGITAVFPAYNDAATIGALIDRTFALLQSSGREFEIVVVNDGSADQTADVLAGRQARYGEALRVVTHPVNRGYGAALRSGFDAAAKEMVFYTDGDGQYDPAELALLLDRWTPAMGLVNGYKIKRHDPAYRVLIGKVYNAFVRLVFGLRVRDVDCDFRLIRRQLLKNARLQSDTGVICVEMMQSLQRLGAEIAEVPVHHYPRESGRSQFFRFRAVADTLLQLMRLYFHRSPAARPVAQELPETNFK